MNIRKRILIYLTKLNQQVNLAAETEHDRQLQREIRRTRNKPDDQLPISKEELLRRTANAELSALIKDIRRWLQSEDTFRIIQESQEKKKVEPSKPIIMMSYHFSDIHLARLISVREKLNSLDSTFPQRKERYEKYLKDVLIPKLGLPEKKD